MAKFLKLGKAAAEGSFSDASADVAIAGKQVIKVKAGQIRSDYLLSRLQSGHIVEATEEEYNDWQEAENERQSESIKEVKKKRKLGRLAATSIEEEVKDAEDDSEDDEDDDTDDHDEKTDDEKKSKESMIADLKASPLIKDEEKARLHKLSITKLVKLHNKIIAGK